MRNHLRTVILCALCATIAACGAAAAGSKLDEVDKKANQYASKVYIPPFPSPDLKNYEKAQRLYADSNTIIWCTLFPQSNTAPMVTIPIAGKLTSSSVSFFPSSRLISDGNDESDNEYTPERRSVDGMYHGTPPPYRFGFTPGGQYNDVFNMPSYCTTQPLKFQRQSVRVDVDTALDNATGQAEAALKSGNKAEAQRILANAAGS